MRPRREQRRHPTAARRTIPHLRTGRIGDGRTTACGERASRRYCLELSEFTKRDERCLGCVQAWNALRAEDGLEAADKCCFTFDWRRCGHAAVRHEVDEKGQAYCVPCWGTDVDELAYHAFAPVAVSA